MNEAPPHDPVHELEPGDPPVSAAARRKVLVEIVVLWLVTLLAIRGVVSVQKLGLPNAVLAAVPFLFIYAPVWLCARRNVDSYAYRIAIPGFTDTQGWGEAFRWCLRVILIVAVPWFVGYHLYQNWVGALLHKMGPVHNLEDGLQVAQRLVTGKLGVLGLDPLHTLTRTVLPRWRVPEDAWLLVPYHVFFVAIPEEFFYRGYLQTRLNEVFPRTFTLFGTKVGWSIPLACLFFAFGHSLVTLRWWHFATFFPGLAFGWLRERTKSPVAGALFHAWCNVTVTWLDTLYGIR